MTWFKVDDAFHTHAKTLAAGNAALGLWVRCGSWSSQHLTDGHIPADVAKLYAGKGEIQRLINAGLWKEVVGGYQMHDFSEWNPSAESVKAERQAAAERQRKAREAAKSRRDGDEPKETASRRDSRVTNGVTNGVTTPEVAPVVTVPPTRPDPTNDLQNPSGSAAPMTITQRSKRLVDAYAAAEPMCKWPAVNGVVIKAIKAEKYADDEIGAALLRLAKEGRGVTVETLRTELAGFTPRVNGHRPSTTDSRVQAGLDLARRYAAEDE